MSSELSPDTESFIEKEIKLGAFRSRAEVLDASVELLRHRKSMLQKLGKSDCSIEDLAHPELNDAERAVLLYLVVV